MTGVVAGVVTVEMSVGGGGIMTWYRDSLAVYVDGRRLAGGELAEFAGLGYYADYQARMSPDRSLPVLVGGHNKDRLCVRGGFAALVALAASYGAGDGGWARQKHHRWLPVGHPDLPAKTKAQTPCDGKGSCEFPAAGADDYPALCKRHAAGQRKAAANDEARRQKSTARRQKWDEDDRRRRMAGDWAGRLAADFGVDAAAERDGRVGVSGEGLHGLLEAVRAEMPWLLEEMPVELRGVTHSPAGTGS